MSDEIYIEDVSVDNVRVESMILERGQRPVKAIIMDITCPVESVEIAFTREEIEAMLEALDKED